VQSRGSECLACPAALPALVGGGVDAACVGVPRGGGLGGLRDGPIGGWGFEAVGSIALRVRAGAAERPEFLEEFSAPLEASHRRPLLRGLDALDGRAHLSGMSNRQAFPALMFTRRIDDEVRHGLLLSGILVLDLPDTERIDPGTRIPGSDDTVAVLLEHLEERALAGDMDPYEVVFGWRDERPTDADAFRDNVQAQEQWARTRASVRVRMPGTRVVSGVEH